MSDEQESAKIGDLVKEHAKLRKQLALLLEDADRIGETILRVGRYLKSSGYEKKLNRGDTPEFISAMPEKRDLEGLCGEVVQIVERKQKVYMSLKAAGYEPKEE